MSASTSERPYADQRVRAEAAAWIAKLHGPNRSREMERGFRRWLEEHPAHAAEFELATDVWNETGGVSAPALPDPSAARRVGSRPLMKWSLAAGLVVGLLGTLWIVHQLSRSVLSTGTGEQKTITLADGSRVTLNTDSRIVVRYGKHTRTVILRYGEAYFQVVHNRTRPFVVQVGDQKVIDVGTSFMVRRIGSGEKSLSVTVIEGRVAVAPLDVADILPKAVPLKVMYVSAGNRLLLRPHALPSIMTEPARQATAWLRGQLVFSNTALIEAAAQFNRYNRVKIVVGAAKLNQIRVGGVFRTGAAESFARSVAEAHKLRLIVRDDVLILEPEDNVSGTGRPRHP